MSIGSSGMRSRFGHPLPYPTTYGLINSGYLPSQGSNLSQLVLDPARDFTIPSFRKLGVSWKISGPSHRRVGRVSETDLQDAALSNSNWEAIRVSLWVLRVRGGVPLEAWV